MRNRPEVQLGIDVEKEFDHALAIDLTEAAKLLRGRKGRPARESVCRWVTRGVTVKGLRLRLPAVKLGGVFATLPAWVEAFQRAWVRLGVPPPAPDITRLPQTRFERERALRDARRVLDAG